MHILVKHKLVAMGVATGSLLVGGGIVATYTSRAEFEAEFAQALGAPQVLLHSRCALLVKC